jgi:AraC family transcriptional regulator, transcriptional activator of pobA
VPRYICRHRQITTRQFYHSSKETIVAGISYFANRIMKQKNNDKIQRIHKVKYNFKGSVSLQIDVVPIAERLLANQNKPQTTTPHRTTFHRIIWFQKGNPSHLVDFKKINIKSPAILFINKDRIHKFDRDKLHDGKVLIFTDDFFFRTEQDKAFLQNAKIFNLNENPFLITNVDERLAEFFTAIEKEIGQKDQLFKSETSYHLLNSFLYTAERFASFQVQKTISLSPDASLTNSFFKLIEKHYKERFTVEKYAELLNITTSKLNTAIKITKGKTGKQVLTERVLLEAKRLLVHSELSVKEIGFQLGFEEPTNFIKFFRSNIKQTPVEFQKNNI